ncbi:MAG: hypothetical protein Ta2G_11080 [Termitinemataceae bacterium]|nr:MAG: hypothetical protein Ta2G_11080 [Termitinemataceae bacterium]
MVHIQILYEDDDCLVLDKPAGLAVQGGKGVITSLDAILAEVFEDSERPLLVHRLDKETSGVILAAKNQRAAAFYSGKIASKEIRKYYTVICSLQDAYHLPDEGTIDSKILIKGQKKTALTHYKMVKKNKRATGFCHV